MAEVAPARSALVGAVLTEREFRRVRDLVREHTGIQLGDNKRQLCQTRLVRRLRALGLRSFRDYLAVLEDPDAAEHGELVNAITTNVTSFFREPHHFELLARQVLPRFIGGGRLRVWSAGCSSGEEPWCLAMVLHEVLPEAARKDARILATDIDTDVLARAEAGVYADDRVEPVSVVRRQRYLAKGTGANAGNWRIKDELRSSVVFRRLNLMDQAWPMKGPFDVIFCRNVIIYFDADDKQRLLRRYQSLLAPGGYLFLGHSESLVQGVTGLAPCDQTVYRKTGTS
jgi:chemotaxis protein methyltransferase CheR